MTTLSCEPTATPMIETPYPHWPTWAPSDVAVEGADAHRCLLDASGRPTARLSLWWVNVPGSPADRPGHRLGLIGHFAATNGADAGELLEHACDELRAQGCTLAVGPINGNTMRHYRLMTERGSEPSFIMEPDNPDEWPLWWGDAEFLPLARYYSGITDDLTQEDERIEPARKRLASNGIVIRTMGNDYLADLRRIYAVAQVSFANNYLASPFTEEEFLARYLPYEPLVRHEYVLLAEQEGRPVGFMFSLPDFAQAERGEAICTLVMKTFAVLPGRTYAGLGNVLLANTTRLALEAGYARAIHALMYEHNNSLLISTRFTRVFRRYTLFARELTP